ncbi:MAG: TolC family protein [Phycisphaeraceae bacterium]
MLTVLVGGLSAAGVAGCAQPKPWDFDEVVTREGLGPVEHYEQKLPRDFQPADEAVQAEAEAAKEAVFAEGPLALSVEQAVLLALRNNRELSVQQFEPLIAGTFVELERAVFDPVLFGELQIGRDQVESVSRATGQAFSVEGEDMLSEIGLLQRLPTGTTIEGTLTQRQTDSDRTPEQHTVRAGFTVTQALLRGFGTQTNLARIRQARLDTQASEFQLRGFAESLIAEVETTYWEYTLARRDIEIVENALELARQQQRETEQRVAVGVLAETEQAAAESEVARREQALIDAQSNVETLQLRLLRLINPNATEEGWSREIEILDAPDMAAVALDEIETHLAIARQLRPDLNEARLLVERNRLEVVQTRSGLLPRLDFFVTLGKTGFSDAFGGAVESIDGPGYDFSAGIVGEYPLGNRAARADQQRAQLSRHQSAQAVNNLSQLVELDVRTALVEVRRARRQIRATQLTSELQEQTLEAETQKFRVGKSTTLLVAQAQRDLLESQLEAVAAVVRYRQALVELYRLEGSLLERRGIMAPGRDGGVQRLAQQARGGRDTQLREAGDQR